MNPVRVSEMTREQSLKLLCQLLKNINPDLESAFLRVVEHYDKTPNAPVTPALSNDMNALIGAGVHLTGNDAVHLSPLNLPQTVGVTNGSLQS